MSFYIGLQDLNRSCGGLFKMDWIDRFPTILGSISLSIIFAAENRRLKFAGILYK